MTFVTGKVESGDWELFMSQTTAVSQLNRRSPEVSCFKQNSESWSHPSINPSTPGACLGPMWRGILRSLVKPSLGIWELVQPEWRRQPKKQGWDLVMGLVSSNSRARAFPPNPGVCSAFLHLPFPTLEVRDKGL